MWKQIDTYLNQRTVKKPHMGIEHDIWWIAEIHIDKKTFFAYEIHEWFKFRKNNLWKIVHKNFVNHQQWW